MKPEAERFFFYILLLLGLIWGWVVLSVPPAEAAQQNSCDSAVGQAASEYDVPVDVMLAITRAETGRKLDGAFSPWPWTVNIKGKGHWFDSEDQARAFVFDHYKAGARNFDVGCFQVNFKWHGAAFESLDEMFDPLANARYAARFLQDLYLTYGNWADAAGAYHSRTPAHFKRYRARFEDIRSGLGTDDIAVQVAERVNAYPLLFSSTEQRSAGSLVALEPGQRAFITLQGGG